MRLEGLRVRARRLEFGPDGADMPPLKMAETGAEGPKGLHPKLPQPESPEILGATSGLFAVASQQVLTTPTCADYKGCGSAKPTLWVVRTRTQKL